MKRTKGLHLFFLALLMISPFASVVSNEWINHYLLLDPEKDAIPMLYAFLMGTWISWVLALVTMTLSDAEAKVFASSKFIPLMLILPLSAIYYNWNQDNSNVTEMYIWLGSCAITWFCLCLGIMIDWYRTSCDTKDTLVD
jgi:hypothetical protein